MVIHYSLNDKHNKTEPTFNNFYALFTQRYKKNICIKQFSDLAKKLCASNLYKFLLLYVCTCPIYV